MKIHSMVAAAVAAVSIVSGSALAQGRGNGRGNDHSNPPSQAEQQRRIAEQKQHDTQYQHTLETQTHAAQARTAQLQKQKRTAQADLQKRYQQSLQAQQQQLRTARDYAHDPHYSAPMMYRYKINNAYRETTQYGADALRAAVRNGYQEGYQAGIADHHDGWRSDYANAYAYRDATWGFNGSYIDQSDYSYYFRQGFQRGYADGYANSTRYGSYNNGTASILDNVLSSILGLATIH
ncbi:MAG TPA: hypothetical protein VGM50_19620 [Gemmatimonadaceae bacterium]|jgi:hypothetical protein